MRLYRPLLLSLCCVNAGCTTVVTVEHLYFRNHWSWWTAGNTPWGAETAAACTLWNITVSHGPSEEVGGLDGKKSKPKFTFSKVHGRTFRAVWARPTKSWRWAVAGANSLQSSEYPNTFVDLLKALAMHLEKVSKNPLSFETLKTPAWQICFVFKDTMNIYGKKSC